MSGERYCLGHLKSFLPGRHKRQCKCSQLVAEKFCHIRLLVCAAFTRKADGIEKEDDFFQKFCPINAKNRVKVQVRGVEENPA